MKKILVLLVPLMLLTGCGAKPIEKDVENYTYYIQDSISYDFYIDKKNLC